MRSLGEFLKALGNLLMLIPLLVIFGAILVFCAQAATG